MIESAGAANTALIARSREGTTSSPLFYICALYLLLVFLFVPAALGKVISYKESGGLILEKIHPATYLMALAIFLRSGNGKNLFSQSGVNAIVPIGFVLCVVTCLFMGDAGFAAIIVDIFVAPSIFFAVQKSLTFGESKRIARLFIIIALINLPVVLIERLAHVTLYDSGTEHIWIRGIGMQETTRPAGLLEHPLMAGPVCLCAMLILMKRSIFNRSSFYIMIMLLLECALFSVRLPLFLALFLFTTYIGMNLKTAKGKVVGISVFMVLPLVAYGLATSGVFDRIIERGFWDSSAASRINVYAIFDFMSWHEFLYGVSPDRVDKMIELSGSSHLESFFVIAVINCGIIFAVCFTTSILLLFARTSINNPLFAVVFTSTALSSNAFATKGIVVPAFVVVASFLWHFERQRRLEWR